MNGDHIIIYRSIASVGMWSNVIGHGLIRETGIDEGLIETCRGNGIIAETGDTP